MTDEFVGYSPRNDLTEALADAIAKAKNGLTTDYVRWQLLSVAGEAGGFVLTTDFWATISAVGPNQHKSIGPAYFEMIDASKKNFVIKLVSTAQIETARRILTGQEIETIHVQGTIFSSPASYNPRWSFHLEPTSIDFFSNAIEVCDAASLYVEKNLIDVGGDFLPNGHWCPWTSTLVAELSVKEVTVRIKGNV